MTPTDSGTVTTTEKAGRSGPPEGQGAAPKPPAPPPGPRREGALFKRYKGEQGKSTRTGTFIGAGAIIAWGAKFLYDELQLFEGDEAWRLLITTGIPIAFAVVLGAIAWWIVFGQRATGDFMIATEGEMKKVSWSTRKEIIGSTKVVIAFTVFLAVFLFAVDLLFQFIFSNLGVLKT